MPLHTSTMHTVLHEMPENRHSGLKWNGKRDVVEDPQPGRDVGYLSLGKGSSILWGRYLLLFKAEW